MKDDDSLNNSIDVRFGERHNRRRYCWQSGEHRRRVQKGTPFFDVQRDAVKTGLII